MQRCKDCQTRWGTSDCGRCYECRKAEKAPTQHERLWAREHTFRAGLYPAQTVTTRLAKLVCRGCGLHRPGLDVEGVCPSCIRFGKEVLPLEKEPSPIPPAYGGGRAKGGESVLARIIRENPSPRPGRGRPGCHRCGGSGYIHTYSHIEGGRCFACT